MPPNLASDVHPTDMSEKRTKLVTLFSTEWCGYCRRLKRQLADAGIGYVEIDVDEHVEFGAPIMRATGGFRTVPTVEVEGRLLVNPSISEVVRAVAGTAKRG